MSLFQGKQGPGLIRGGYALPVRKAVENVGMTVDQSRQDGRLAKVNHLSSLWNFHLILGPDLDDSIALDQDHLPGRFLTRITVKQASGANGHDRRSLGPQSRRNPQDSEYPENNL